MSRRTLPLRFGAASWWRAASRARVAAVEVDGEAEPIPAPDDALLDRDARLVVDAVEAEKLLCRGRSVLACPLPYGLAPDLALVFVVEVVTLVTEEGVPGRE